jgi:hypothetical protein
MVLIDAIVDDVVAHEPHIFIEPGYHRTRL